MKWMQLRAQFCARTLPEAEELICACFHEAGVTGLVIEDAALTVAPLPDYQSVPDRGAVIGYLPGNASGERTRAAIELALKSLSRDHPDLDIRLSHSLVDEEDWAESWKRFFWPERVAETIVIKPTWREYVAATGDVVLEIDPGMAFGTGTHPTSALCLQMLEHYLRPGLSILDVGTGSGVLLIAGALLGAAAGLGVDKDPVAVAVAAQNLVVNRIDPAHFGVVAGDLAQPVGQRFDVVVSNILADDIVQLSYDLGRIIRPGGIFIGSGIIQSAEPAVSASLEAAGLRLIERRHDQEWVCLVGAAPVKDAKPHTDGVG